MRTQSAMTTITHAVTVAAGVFAPGHLGELTQYLPFELVDDILAQTKTVQRRLRELPSRVGVYFLLALGMYPRLGYARVWAKLTAGLAGLPVPCPSEKALRDLRRRLGPAPLKALFEVVAGPLAQPGTPGVRFGGLRTVAFDGCNSLKVPDTGRNRWWLGRIRYRMGFAGYPTLRLMALAETGTRGLLGAALGSAADRDEATVARRLLPLLHPGMLILLDRAFDGNAFLREVAATGALLVARAKSTRHPVVLSHLPDGSYLSDLDGLQVRIIEASVTVTGADGSRVRGSYRLITTLMDHRRFPAAAVVRLYHERWEIEICHLWCRSSRVVLSLPCSWSAGGGFGGRGPPGAAVKACRAGSALAEPLHFRGVCGDDPVSAVGDVPGGDPSAVDPVVDGGGGHAQGGGQAGDRPLAGAQAG